MKLPKATGNALPNLLFTWTLLWTAFTGYMAEGTSRHPGLGLGKHTSQGPVILGTGVSLIPRPLQEFCCSVHCRLDLLWDCTLPRSAGPESRISDIFCLYYYTLMAEPGKQYICSKKWCLYIFLFPVQFLFGTVALLPLVCFKTLFLRRLSLCLVVEREVGVLRRE